MKRITPFLFLLIATINSEAHVALLNPTGGETFYPCNEIIIEWQELQSHNTLNWDLYFSDDSGLTWKPIEIDITLGTTNYTWKIPDIQTTQGKIKIVQDNIGGYYEDISGNFTISSTTGTSTQIEVIKINLHPNPFIDYSILEFDNPNHNNFTLTLSDTQGRYIKTINYITTNKVIIEKNNLTSGLYFFRLYSDKKVRAIGKFVVE